LSVAEARPPERSRLEADGLQKSYGARKVVKDVHLAVNSGEVVGLLGPNGAGKTTSFYMLVGLVRADAGQIRIDGESVQRLPIHQRARLGLSYLPQEASIFRRLTVEENIRAVLELQVDAAGRHHSRQRIDELLGTLLADLSIDKLRDSPAPALSVHPARRALRRRRPDRGDRDPADHRFPQGARHRRADHRPQRARDAGHLRPRLHHQRRPGVGRGHAGRHRRQRRRSQGLPRRTLPHVNPADPR
jgi:ABC-type glutathione transport system ATPase component